MSLLKSLLRRFSSGGQAAALCERGMAKAKRDDWTGAIADYTAAIDATGATGEVKAMAYFNRALAHAQQGRLEQADADLQKVLAMPDAPPNIKSAAKEKVARWEKRRGR